MFATSHSYTVFDMYIFHTCDLYPTDHLPMIYTTDPYCTDRHCVRIVGVIKDVSGGEVRLGRLSVTSKICSLVPGKFCAWSGYCASYSRH